MDPAWSVIVLTGGSSTRMGTRKDVLELGGLPIVARLLRGLPPEVPVVVVGLPPPAAGPHRTSADDGHRLSSVLVTREDPPGGGPVAGIAAGLPLVTTPVVAIAAGDMPYAGSLIAHLAQLYVDREPTTRHTDRFQRATRPDAILPVDTGGQPQALCAVYDTAALRDAIEALGSPGGRPVRELVGLLQVSTIPVADVGALIDIDTPDDLATARALTVGVGEQPTIMAGAKGGAMEQWIDAVKQELGLDVEVDLAQILDVAKDAAHSVQRPAAPVTTYLLGYAVASGADPGEAAGVIRRLASDWSAPE